MKIIEHKNPAKLTFNPFEIKCNKSNKVPYKIYPIDETVGIYDCCDSKILIDSIEDINIVEIGHEIPEDEYVVHCPVCNNYINITKEFNKSNNGHVIDFIKRI